MHTIQPNVYRACESVGVTQKSSCEPFDVTQETHDHNYFRTQSVVNKVHPLLTRVYGCLKAKELSHVSNIC